MRIKHRFSFSNTYTDITRVIEQTDIMPDKQEILTTFEIFEDSRYFELIKKTFESHDIMFTITEAEFTKDEMNESQWFSIRSTWRYGYPQPEDEGYKSSTYDNSGYCDKCKSGLVQKASFSIKKAPTWNSRNFLMINLIHDELFVSNRAESVLQSSNLSGFTFCSVLNYKNQILESIKQLRVTNQLNNGLKKKSISQEFICPQCSKKKYIIKPGFIYYSGEAFKDVQVDIIKSSEEFGGIGSDNTIFITKKFYELLEVNKLGRGLAYRPVRLF